MSVDGLHFGSGADLSRSKRGYPHCSLPPTMVRYLRAEVCVGAALFRRHRLLLLRRSSTLSAFPGSWDIPGGHVESDEGLMGALRREVREETGYKIAVHRPFHVGIFDYPRAVGDPVETVEVDFLCSVESANEPRLNPSEHTDYAWIRDYNPRQHPAPLQLRRIIREAFASR